MVVRLSNKRAKTTKNALLPLKWPFVGQPYNHIGWATSLAYSWVSSTYPRTISWNFGEKMFRIGGFEKLTFFQTTKFQYSKFKKIEIFLPHSYSNVSLILWVAWICFKFYDYSDCQQKIRGCVIIWDTLYLNSLTGSEKAFPSVKALITY